MKVVEGQILRGKVVSQASFGSLTPKLDRFKIQSFTGLPLFEIEFILDWVNQMKLAIPVFHVEFDPLQLSFTGLLKIPPCGDFGDFWWLFWRFSQKGRVMAF